MLHYSLNFTEQDPLLPNHFKDFLKDLPLYDYLHKPFSGHLYEEVLNKFKSFSKIIHLGTGGSSLGPQALYALAENPTKKVLFFDNIDPDTFNNRLQNLDFMKTGLIVASKSGNTAETLVQLATLKKIYDNQKIDLQNHLVIMTQTDDNALHTFAKNNHILVVPHHTQIGGRFAVFAEVGMLLGLLVGLDMQAFTKGAQDAIAAFEKIALSPVLATAHFLASSKMHPVIFSYADKLKVYGAWFAQLWAESLGKKNNVGKSFGSTPIQALGATDQHSQLQLYLDGPRDKFFTFLETSEKSDFQVADLNIDHQAYKPLRGHSLRQLLNAERRATYETMRAHHLPLRLITLPAINTYYVGQLMMNAVLETLAVSQIWDVNPFNQPAVEEGKILALKFLNDKNNETPKVQ